MMMRYAVFLFALQFCRIEGQDHRAFGPEDEVAKAGRKKSWLSSQGPTLDELLEKFPTIDPDTVERFFDDGPNASSKLTSYLQWQNGHTVSHVDSDVERWNMAVQQSYGYVSNPPPGKMRGTALEGAPPYEVLFDTELMDHFGHPVLVFYPCLLDLSIAGAVPLYTDIFLTFIESFFVGIDPHEKFTLIMDIRPGRGWPNPAERELVNSIKVMSNAIEKLEPGRLFQLLAFPVPAYGTGVYQVMKPFMDKHLQEEIVIIPGRTVKLHSPVPVGELTKYVDRAVVETAEKLRHSLFQPKDDPASKMEELAGLDQMTDGGGDIADKDQN